MSLTTCLRGYATCLRGRDSSMTSARRYRDTDAVYAAKRVRDARDWNRRMLMWIRSIRHEIQERTV